MNGTYEASDASRPFFFARVAISIIGTIANMLSFAVMWKDIRTKATHFYLAAASILDSVYLVVIGVHLMLVLTDFVFSDAICKTLFTSATSATVSAMWTVSAMSCERCFVILWPFRARNASSFRRNVIIELSILFASFIVSSPQLVYITSNPNTGECVIDPSHGLLEFHELLILALFSVLPVAVILTSNILIIYRVRISGIQLTRSGSVRTSRNNEVTRMLLLVSLTTAILLILPATYHIAIYLGGNPPAWVFYVSLLLHSVNHSANFFLYCLGSSGFRRDFIALFSSCCTPGSHAQRSVAYVADHTTAKGSVSSVEQSTL